MKRITLVDFRRQFGIIKIPALLELIMKLFDLQLTLSIWFVAVWDRWHEQLASSLCRQPVTIRCENHELGLRRAEVCNIASLVFCLDLATKRVSWLELQRFVLRTVRWIRVWNVVFGFQYLASSAHGLTWTMVSLNDLNSSDELFSDFRLWRGSYTRLQELCTGLCFVGRRKSAPRWVLVGIFASGWLLKTVELHIVFQAYGFNPMVDECLEETFVLAAFSTYNSKHTVPPEVAYLCSELVRWIQLSLADNLSHRDCVKLAQNLVQFRKCLCTC